MNNEMENYDFTEHLHRYAIWTAARSQRGVFASNILIDKTLTKINLKEEAFKLSFDMNADEFDDWHSKKCNELLKALGLRTEFGRTAKLINIYLKTTIVVPNCNKESSLVDSIHPPVDRILLKNLVNQDFISKKLFIAWTTMEEDIYREIISSLRRNFIPLWKAECNWKANEE